MTISHETAHNLRTDFATSWGAGVNDAKRHLVEGLALTSEEACAIADRFYSQPGDNGTTDPGAAAYWGGYAAGVIRYRKVPGMSVIAAGERERTYSRPGYPAGLAAAPDQVPEWARNTMRPECPACGGYLLPCTATDTGIHPDLPHGSR